MQIVIFAFSTIIKSSFVCVIFFNLYCLTCSRIVMALEFGVYYRCFMTILEKNVITLVTLPFLIVLSRFCINMNWLWWFLKYHILCPYKTWIALVGTHRSCSSQYSVTNNNDSYVWMSKRSCTLAGFLRVIWSSSHYTLLACDRCTAHIPRDCPFDWNGPYFLSLFSPMLQNRTMNGNIFVSTLWWRSSPQSGCQDWYYHYLCVMLTISWCLRTIPPLIDGYQLPVLFIIPKNQPYHFPSSSFHQLDRLLQLHHRHRTSEVNPFFHI